MRRKKVHPSIVHNWTRSETYDSNGRTVIKDDIIRIDGQQGQRFIFLQHVVNNDNGAEWIDCHEIHKGAVGMWRSFRPEQIRFLSDKKKPRVYKKKSKVVE